MFFTQNKLDDLIVMIRECGDLIAKHYDEISEIEMKDDNTPLTKTDIASHKFLSERLSQITPNIPIISEESSYLPFEERKTWDEFWIIDPLDGTRGFIDKTDDFCVCIAYIKNNKPVFGMVYLPMRETHYYANENDKAYKLRDGKSTQIFASEPKTPLRAVVGRYSTAHPRVVQHMKYVTQNGRYKINGIGSAVKICLIAEGVFDYYPGLGTCSEWDTAAAGYVLTASGGHIHDFDGKPMRYNTKNDMLSPMFFASGKSIFSREA